MNNGTKISKIKRNHPHSGHRLVMFQTVFGIFIIWYTRVPNLVKFLLISPIQSPSSTPVVSSRVLYGVQHTRSTSRDGDNLWDTGNLCYCVDNGSYYLVFSSKTNFCIS